MKQGRPLVTALAALVAVAGLQGTALVARPVLAQAWPAKPVRIVVPYAAGGATDTVARAIGQRLSDQLGQPVVIDNRGGGGAVIGTEVVARAAPDGYTVLLAVGPPHSTFPLFARPMPFDSVRDFTPVAILATLPQVVAVNASVPVKTLRELIEYGRSRPGKLSYGTTGVGSSQHLGGEMLNAKAGIDMVHVAYKGGAPLLTDLLGGQIPVGVLVLSNVLPHVKTGKLQALAVIEAHRADASPETPTVAEAGLPGFAVPSTWIGLLGPAGLPAPIVGRLQAELATATVAPDVRSKLEAAGFQVKVSSSREFAEQLAASVDVYRGIVNAARITLE